MPSARNPSARTCRRDASGVLRLEIRRRPSPSTIGRCPNRGIGPDAMPSDRSAACSGICRGVDGSRSSPRSTSVMPMTASSTGLVSG